MLIFGGDFFVCLFEFLFFSIFVLLFFFPFIRPNLLQCVIQIYECLVLPHRLYVRCVSDLMGQRWSCRGDVHRLPGARGDRGGMGCQCRCIVMNS